RGGAAGPHGERARHPRALEAPARERGALRGTVGRGGAAGRVLLALRGRAARRGGRAGGGPGRAGAGRVRAGAAAARRPRGTRARVARAECRESRAGGGGAARGGGGVRRGDGVSEVAYTRDGRRWYFRDRDAALAAPLPEDVLGILRAWDDRNTRTRRPFVIEFEGDNDTYIFE